MAAGFLPFVHGGLPMLVLSRKAQQSIVIDGRITVTVVSINGSAVRIGVEADKSIPVHRGEVFERLAQTSNVPAAGCLG